MKCFLCCYLKGYLVGHCRKYEIGRLLISAVESLQPRKRYSILKKQKKNIYSQTINIVTNCIGSSIEFVKIGCQEPVDLRKIAKLPGKSL